MGKIKSFGVFESYKNQEERDNDQLDLITKSMDQWRNFYLELPDHKKEKYLKHFQIEKFILRNTAEMLVLFRPLENDKFLINWVKEREHKMPKDFLEIFGVDKDLKELGF